MRSWPEPPVAASSRSRLTRGSMRMMSRTSRLNEGALCITSVVNEVPGPTSSWVTLARAAVTTMAFSLAASAAGDSAKVSCVGPWSVVLMSLTVCPWKPFAIAVTV